MLSRRFTTREKILLLVLALILLGELYFLLVHQRVERELAEAQGRIETATVSYNLEQARAAKKQEMLEKIRKATSDSGVQPLPDYDNSTNVVAYLNGVMAAAEEYNLVFNPVDFNDYAAIRPINMTFSCRNYAAVRDIVAQLEDGPYYCEVTALLMSAEDGIGDMRGELVSVQMTAVFYEYAGDEAAETDEAA